MFTDLDVCSSCGADWSNGAFSETCAECDGGAMDIDCIVCRGQCGRRWRRAVMDSHDSGVAHWVGSCGLSDADTRIASLAGQAITIEWWLDDSALPDLWWACLVEFGDNGAVVIDRDNKEHRFSGYDEAVEWLREDEFDSLQNLVDEGSVDAKIKGPVAFPW